MRSTASILAAAFVLAQSALATTPVTTAIPDVIATAKDESLLYARHAKGVQIYLCTLQLSGETKWHFVAPQANLYSPELNSLVGTHSIGPIWQENDGAFVKAAKVSEVSVDSTAIPWLLLKVNESSKNGPIAGVTSIHRVNTTGGLAPAADACTQDKLGSIQQVPYTADYYFYTKAK